MTLRLGVTGATGQMGEEVLTAAHDRQGCEVVVATSRSGGDDRSVGGVDLDPADAFADLLVDREATVVVDFTAPAAAVEYAAACAETDVAFVTGTTGFDEDQLAALEETATKIPLLRAPNFSRGVQALVTVVGEAVRSLPGYDVELVERHHNRKRDAPSGTANRLLDEIEAAGEFAGRSHGREGEVPRTAGEIGVHALRAGDLTGEHEVSIAGDHEELRLTHRADDRGVFAEGALDAAEWLAGRDPGDYDFAEVIHE